MLKGGKLEEPKKQMDEKKIFKEEDNCAWRKDLRASHDEKKTNSITHSNFPWHNQSSFFSKVNDLQ